MNAEMILITVGGAAITVLLSIVSFFLLRYVVFSRKRWFKGRL